MENFIIFRVDTLYILWWIPKLGQTNDFVTDQQSQARLGDTIMAKNKIK